MKQGTVNSTSYQKGFLAADVRAYRTDVVHKCMVLTPFGGHLQSIEEGTEVIIDKTETGLWLVLGVYTADADRFPDSIEKQDQIITFDDGTKIEAKYNGSEYDVNIEASGDININVTGNVTIDGDGDIKIGDPAESVAIQDHTHTFTDTGDTSDGSGPTYSRDTTFPNEEGTDTIIQ